MKHTPGPWDRGARCGHPGLDGRAVNNIHVIAPTYVPFVARIVAIVPDGDSYGEGNARLIAAAPELLAVAVEAENWFDNHGDEDDEGAQGLLRMFRAVIAKAEGR